MDDRPGTLPQGTVTFLFSDIEGSTRLAQALGADRWEALLREHDLARRRRGRDRRRRHRQARGRRRVRGLRRRRRPRSRRRSRSAGPGGASVDDDGPAAGPGPDRPPHGRRSPDRDRPRLRRHRRPLRGPCRRRRERRPDRPVGHDAGRPSRGTVPDGAARRCRSVRGGSRTSRSRDRSTCSSSRASPTTTGRCGPSTPPTNLPTPPTNFVGRDGRPRRRCAIGPGRDAAADPHRPGGTGKTRLALRLAALGRRPVPGRRPGSSTSPRSATRTSSRARSPPRSTSARNPACRSRRPSASHLQPLVTPARPRQPRAAAAGRRDRRRRAPVARRPGCGS